MFSAVYFPLCSDELTIEYPMGTTSEADDKLANMVLGGDHDDVRCKNDATVRFIRFLMYNFRCRTNI